MFKERWRDRAGLVFAIGIWGHVTLGCVIGVVSASFFEGIIDFEKLAAVVGAMAALFVAIMAVCAFGDWRRSLQYGRRIEHAQNLKRAIFRLRAAMHRYSDCQKNKVDSQKADRAVEAAYAQFKIDSSLRFNERHFRVHIEEIREEIKSIEHGYRDCWELLKMVVDENERTDLISYEAVASFLLNFYDRVSLCERELMTFRELNKAYVSGRIEDMLAQVDTLLR